MGRFADGARLRVVDRSAVEGRALWQPLGLAASYALSSRNTALREALQEDLRILGVRNGVVAELDDGECGGITLRAPPAVQRVAVGELQRLLTFYLPELGSSPL